MRDDDVDTAGEKPAILEVEKIIEVEVGKTYVTRGGWEAIVVWKISRAPGSGLLVQGRFITEFYAVHKPGTNDESVPIGHDYCGYVLTTFSVCEAPTYDVGHPADIILEKKHGPEENSKDNP